MRKKLFALSAPGLLALSVVTSADDSVPTRTESLNSLSYNAGLFSQYIFRGLTQTGEKPALQGGVDYSHSSGFYAGAWASNVSWLEDAGAYQNSSLEMDFYGGYARTLGTTGLGYDAGVLQYIYPGDKNPGIKAAQTTEVYASLGYDWLSAKASVVASNGAFGFADAAGSWYVELNAAYTSGATGFGIEAHYGRQEFAGKAGGVDNSFFDYSDWKIGISKSWDNDVNVGVYYTDTNADRNFWTDASKQYLGDGQFSVFAQKVF